MLITNIPNISTKDTPNEGRIKINEGFTAYADALEALRLAGGISFKGEWDAHSNYPQLVSGSDSRYLPGDYYKVSVAGTLNPPLDGVANFRVGDWVIYNGQVWEKLNLSESVLTVNGQVGNVVIPTADPEAYRPANKPRLSDDIPIVGEFDDFSLYDETLNPFAGSHGTWRGKTFVTFQVTEDTPFDTIRYHAISSRPSEVHALALEVYTARTLQDLPNPLEALDPSDPRRPVRISAQGNGEHTVILPQPIFARAGSFIRVALVKSEGALVGFAYGDKTEVLPYQLPLISLVEVEVAGPGQLGRVASAGESVQIPVISITNSNPKEKGVVGPLELVDLPYHTHPLSDLECFAEAMDLKAGRDAYTPANPVPLEGHYETLVPDHGSTPVTSSITGRTVWNVLTLDQHVPFAGVTLITPAGQSTNGVSTEVTAILYNVSSGETLAESEPVVITGAASQDIFFPSIVMAPAGHVVAVGLRPRADTSLLGVYYPVSGSVEGISNWSSGPSQGGVPPEVPQYPSYYTPTATPLWGATKGVYGRLTLDNLPETLINVGDEITQLTANPSLSPSMILNTGGGGTVRFSSIDTLLTGANFTALVNLLASADPAALGAFLANVDPDVFAALFSGVDPEVLDGLLQGTDPTALAQLLSAADPVALGALLSNADPQVFNNLLAGANPAVFNGLLANADPNAIPEHSHPRVTSVISQAGHSFAFGSILAYSEGKYVLAHSGTPELSVVAGVVTRVIDGNSFELTHSGMVEAFSNLTPSAVHYLNNSSLSATPGSPPVPVLLAVTPSKGILYSLPPLSDLGEEDPVETGSEVFSVIADGIFHTNFPSDARVSLSQLPAGSSVRFFAPSLLNVGLVEVESPFYVTTADVVQVEVRDVMVRDYIQLDWVEGSPEATLQSFRATSDDDGITGVYRVTHSNEATPILQGNDLELGSKLAVDKLGSLHAPTPADELTGPATITSYSTTGAPDFTYGDFDNIVQILPSIDGEQLFVQGSANGYQVIRAYSFEGNELWEYENDEITDLQVTRNGVFAISANPGANGLTVEVLEAVSGFIISAPVEVAADDGRCLILDQVSQSSTFMAWHVDGGTPTLTAYVFDDGQIISSFDVSATIPTALSGRIRADNHIFVLVSDQTIVHLDVSGQLVAEFSNGVLSIVDFFFWKQGLRVFETTGSVYNLNPATGDYIPVFDPPLGMIGVGETVSMVTGWTLSERLLPNERRVY